MSSSLHPCQNPKSQIRFKTSFSLYRGRAAEKGAGGHPVETVGPKKDAFLRRSGRVWGRSPRKKAQRSVCELLTFAIDSLARAARSAFTDGDKRSKAMRAACSRVVSPLSFSLPGSVPAIRRRTAFSIGQSFSLGSAWVNWG